MDDGPFFAIERKQHVLPEVEEDALVAVEVRGRGAADLFKGSTHAHPTDAFDAAFKSTLLNTCTLIKKTRNKLCI